jgi:hypothetical protein
VYDRFLDGSNFAADCEQVILSTARRVKTIVERSGGTDH